MVAAVRHTPDSTNAVLPYNAPQYQRDVNNEIIALWRYAAEPLTSVAGTNDITATTDTAVVSAITAYATGMKRSLIPLNTNTGGVTLNVDSAGVKNVKDADAATLVAGALVAGRMYGIEYDGTQWRVLAGGTSLAAAAFSVAPDLMLRDEKSNGTNAGTFTSGSMVQRTLNTVLRNALAGASLSANRFTLQAGTYYVEWSAPACFVNTHQTRLYNVTDAAMVPNAQGTSERQDGTGASASNTRSFGAIYFTITTAKQFEVQHQCALTLAGNGLGSAAGLGIGEVYTIVNVWKVGTLASEVDGISGGGMTFPIIFSTTTADADPGAGILRLNNATQNAATFAYVDLSDANLTDISGLLASLDDWGSSGNRGIFKLSKYDDPTKWISFNIQTITSAAGYFKLAISLVGFSVASPFANTDRLIFSFTPTGLTGATGVVSVGSTDNAAVRADGTGGATVQGSLLIIDDTGHVSSFGGNIKFPGTQVASADANTLDDYEEGTWTPVVTFATAGDLNVVYSSQSADYTKNGRDVRAHFLTALSTFTHTTASGALRITGVPFAVANAGISYTVACFFSGITKAGYTQVNGTFQLNSSNLAFFASASAAAISAVVAADMPTGGAVTLAGGGTYRV